MGKLQGKLLEIETYLNSVMVDRTEEIRGLVLASISSEKAGHGQNIMLIGPPGTGKSYAVEHFSRCFSTAGEVRVYFETLLHKFTKLGDLFGPEDFQALTDLKKIVRQWKKFSPNAYFIFLDEIWKANSILNSLLKLVNERKFWEDGDWLPVPLISAIGASNEYPVDGELNALKDRFLFWYEVKYLKSGDSFMSYMTGFQNSAKFEPPTPMPIEELHAAQDEVRSVNVTKDTFKKYDELRAKLRDLYRVEVSDRRWRQTIPVVQAVAWLDGRTQTEPEDLVSIAPCLWSNPKDQNTVKAAVLTICNSQLAEINTIYDLVITEFEEYTKVGGSAITFKKKLEEQIKLMEEIKPSPRNENEYFSKLKGIKRIEEHVSNQVVIANQIEQERKKREQGA